MADSLLVSSGRKGGSKAVAAVCGAIRNAAAMVNGRGV